MTDRAYDVVETPRFSIGQVLADSFDAFFHTFLRLAGIVLIIAVPLLVWVAMGGGALLTKFATATRFEASTRHFDPVMAVLFVLVGLISLAIHAAVSDAAFKHLLDEEGDILENLRRALLATPSLIAVGLFTALVFGIGCFLIVLAAGLLSAVMHWSVGAIVGIAGLGGLGILMVQWWLLVPAIVIEQCGPVECFTRSSRLTDGQRWKIFALILMVYVPEMLLKFLLIAFVPALGAIAIGAADIVVSGVFIAFNAVITVTIYGHLRALKEGAGTEGLADVFT